MVNYLKEWNVGKQKVLWDEENRIMHMIFREEISPDEAEILMDEDSNMYKEMGDLEKIRGSLVKYDGKVTFPKESRDLMAEKMKPQDNSNKTAMVKMPTSMKVMTKVFMKLTGVTNYKFFDDEDNAMKWLMEDDQ